MKQKHVWLLTVNQMISKVTDDFQGFTLIFQDLLLFKASEYTIFTSKTMYPTEFPHPI